MNADNRVSFVRHTERMLSDTLLLPIRYAKSRQLREESGKFGLGAAVGMAALEVVPVVVCAIGLASGNRQLTEAGVFGMAALAVAEAGTIIHFYKRPL